MHFSHREHATIYPLQAGSALCIQICCIKLGTREQIYPWNIKVVEVIQESSETDMSEGDMGNYVA